ncbi:MAG: polyphenol oxidase family protein [Clostridia bacterium]|nr:polyphenol oxidase family protein [Clostridia bacterium]
MNTGFSVTEKKHVKLISVDCINSTGKFRAYYSTGYSGVSKNLPNGTTMNLNLFKKFKDPELDVTESCGKVNPRKNMQLFSDACGFSLNSLAAVHEIHSNTVFQAQSPERGAIFDPLAYRDGDAQVALPSDRLTLFVYASDCCTMLLADPSSGIYATTHCGWKNSLNGTIHNWIEKFVQLGGSKEDAIIAIGPALDRNCMEIGTDVYRLFMDYSGDFAEDIYPSPYDEGKYYIDLFAINTKLLINEGIKSQKIYPSNICNKCELMLPSFRRDHGRNGVMAGIIYPI